MFKAKVRCADAVKVNQCANIYARRLDDTLHFRLLKQKNTTQDKSTHISSPLKKKHTVVLFIMVVVAWRIQP